MYRSFVNSKTNEERSTEAENCQKITTRGLTMQETLTIESSWLIAFGVARNNDADKINTDKAIEWYKLAESGWANEGQCYATVCNTGQYRRCPSKE